MMGTTTPLGLRAARGGALALALALAVGCGGRRMCQVAGKVVYRDGSPFTEGLVVYEPTEPGVRISARGPVKRDGTFRIGTWADDPPDGVLEGHYKVMVVPPLPTEESKVPPAVDPKYFRPETTPLEHTVVRGNNEITLEVERPSGQAKKSQR